MHGGRSVLKSAALTWVRIAALVGFLAVAFGAFGAHGLRGKVAENLLASYQTGALYHLVHAAVLLALALYGRSAAVGIGVPAALFVGGIVLFSGSLYAMAITGATRLGMVTPVGGLLLLGGWVATFVVLGRG